MDFFNRKRKLSFGNNKSKQSENKDKGSITKARVAVFGCGRVGKTSIIKRYLYEEFDHNYYETIEDIHKKVVFCNNQSIELTVLDTAGNYQFPAMRELAIKQSNGFILVYAIDNVPSFEEAIRLRDIIVSVKNNEDTPILLVGNKTDAGFRRVQRVEASAAMKDWGSKAQHIETSAKNNENIDLLFNSLIAMIDEQNNEQLELSTFKDATRYRFSSMRQSVRNSTRRASAKTLSFVRREKSQTQPMVNGRKTLQSIS
ncbi:GTP-binding protein Di-Ras1-like isoform X2 [Clytia hemisphaerica]|uniref:Uncharacterized protein n=1 Tax=Clytia hemisphaerica TaxID=252671 RepID=A0A7M6DPT0_9CNID